MLEKRIKFLEQMVVLVGVVVITLAGPAQAQETDQAEDKLNSIELFIGATHFESENEASFGLTYARQLNEKFGLGFTAEYTTNREYVYILPLTWYPVEHWGFAIAPGVEADGGEKLFVVRVSVEYELEFNGWSLAPELSFDSVDADLSNDTTSTILGINIGRKF